jgi:hypothetical protein
LLAFAKAAYRSQEQDMNGLGGLNKSPDGVVIGLVQLQLPVVVTKADLARQTDRIVYMVGKARRNLGTMDLVVFPEYSLHGLSMDTNPAIMCRLDGPEVAAFKQACVDNNIWGCFSIMEFNPDGNPYNSGLIIDDHGEIKLYYRKFHPWIPVEPWEPGDIGIPVIDGPKGAKLALIICHDGMFPEMARECAYKGAEIMIRTAGYTAPIRDSWRFTNQANDVAIGGRRLHGRVDIDAVGAVEVGVIVPLQAADQIGRHESVSPRLRLLGDEVPETRQCHAGRAALIDQRRDAGLDADHVCIHAEAAGDILIDMGMGIDQPGQHDFAGHIGDFSGACRQNIGLNGGNFAVADGDVLEAVDAGRRIDDATPAQKQVECGADSHDGSPLPVARAWFAAG